MSHHLVSILASCQTGHGPGNSALGFDLVVYGGSNALFAAEYRCVVLKVNSAF
jgi:hypothetical protein